MPIKTTIYLDDFLLIPIYFSNLPWVFPDYALSTSIGTFSSLPYLEKQKPDTTMYKVHLSRRLKRTIMITGCPSVVNL